MCSGMRQLCILAGHQQGVGMCVQGHTDCVQDGAGPEKVLPHVDDGVADGVEHLDGQVSLHGAWRGARTHNDHNTSKNSLTTERTAPCTARSRWSTGGGSSMGVGSTA